MSLSYSCDVARENLTETHAMYCSVYDLKQQVADMEGNYNECLDTIWMLLAAMLVFFMHAGFSLLEAGCVRFKNTQNILTKNFLVVNLGFLCWYVWGWAFAYGVEDDPSSFIGSKEFFTIGFFQDLRKLRNWFFQGAFCATAGTIVSGAMAERTKLRGFGIFTFLVTSFVYPSVVYWCWSGKGFLNKDGKSIVGSPFIDFAGSGIVHMCGGIAALIGAIAVGPRKGRWERANEEAFDGHSIPFCVLGTFFLWFGWYGFNPGSTLSMHTTAMAHKASLVAVNTTLAPCVAGLAVFALRALVVAPKCLDVGAFCNGILAGLVSITAACASVKPWEALIIGFISAFVYQGSSMTVKKFKVDDVVDAFSVHGACGTWAVIAAGIFGQPEVGGNGLLYGGDQLGVQLFAVFIILVWVLLWCVAIFFPLKKVGWLRLGDEFQDKGADLMEHSPSKAYSS